MNSQCRGYWLCLACGLIAWAAFAEEQKSSPTNAPGLGEIRVLDVVFTGTGCLRIGTNTMSVAAATNLLAVKREMLDVVAVHGAEVEMAPEGTQSSSLARIAGIGVPLLLVEKDGEYAWRERTGTDGVRTVRMGTEQFAALRRLWRHKKAAPEKAPAATVQTTIQWDTVSGAYDLTNVELGLFGKRVWIVHEQRQADEESGTIGIRIKKEW